MVLSCILLISHGGLQAGDADGLHQPLPGDIIINEIMVDPDVVSDADGEYLELYNSTDMSIDLNGMVLRDQGVDYHVIENGNPLVIGPGGYLVLARNATFSENGGFHAEYEYNGFVLSNTLDEVILESSEGEVIDTITYSRDLGFPLEEGGSLELRNPLWDNTMAITWKRAVQSFGDGDSGTPGQDNSVVEDFKWIVLDAVTEEEIVFPGDSLIVRVVLFNPCWLDWDCDASSFLVLPNGSPFWGNPVDGPVSLTMSEGRCLQVRKAYCIPDAAFPGVYQLFYGVREHGGDVLDCERVDFEVGFHRTK
jgi:hypothetical protein